MGKGWNWRKGVLLLLIIVVLILGYRVKEIFAVIFAALALAYLLEPLVKFIEAHRFTRTAAIGTVYILGAAIVGGILFWTLPKLNEQIVQLEELLPA